MLLNKAYKDYQMYTVLPCYKTIRKIAVVGGREQTVKTFTQKGFECPLTNEEISRLQYKYDLPQTLNAPIDKDKVVGKLEIYLDNHLLFSEKIYTMDSVKKIGVWSSIQDIISQW